MIVCDTCTLLWWTLDPEHLSKKAQQLLGAAESEASVLVSSISIWELALKVKKKKIELPIPPQEFVSRLRSTGVVSIIPVDEQLWLDAVTLDWSHTDHVDRVIVSLARSRSLPLVSPDREMRSFYHKTVR